MAVENVHGELKKNSACIGFQKLGHILTGSRSKRPNHVVKTQRNEAERLPTLLGPRSACEHRIQRKWWKNLAFCSFQQESAFDRQIKDYKPRRYPKYEAGIEASRLFLFISRLFSVDLMEAGVAHRPRLMTARPGSCVTCTCGLRW